MVDSRSIAGRLALPLMGVAAVGVAGCGSSGGGSGGGSQAKPSSAHITINPSGKSAKLAVPKTVKGGLVQLSVQNNTKRPAPPLQLIQVKGGHTVPQALKAIAGQNTSAPPWVRGAGGTDGISPGQTATAVLKLPAGTYGAALIGGGPGSPSGPPPFAQFKVSGGKGGSLPSTQTTVTAATAGKNKYKWQISGALKPGANRITFDSKGPKALHLIASFRLKGNASKAQILKALKQENGRPPSFVDTTSFNSSAVLDGGKSQVTPYTFRKPGRYVLFCPLSDRGESKPHFEEGLLTTVTVK